MLQRVEFTETNEGFVEIDIPEGATEDEIEEMAIDAINDGQGIYSDGWHDIHTEKLDYDEDGGFISEEDEDE